MNDAGVAKGETDKCHRFPPVVTAYFDHWRGEGDARPAGGNGAKNRGAGSEAVKADSA